MQDLIIIGSGPAALTAAIYAARADLKTLVLERAKIGGALSEISHLANFPGFDGNGAELAASMRRQAESFGATFSYANADKIIPDGDNFIVNADGEAISARAVLLATGSEPVPLNFTATPPVSYCALCDAALYKGKKLLVIGGGNSAVGESLLLAKLADSVTIMTHSVLKAEKNLISQLRQLKNIQIIENTEPTPENSKAYDGIFVYIGKRPASGLLAAAQLDEKGYAKTLPGSHQVTKGIYAAGDLRSGSTKQAITAAADGAEAAIEIIKYLDDHAL